MSIRSLLIAACMLLASFQCVADNKKMLRMDLKYGSVYIELDQDKAPMHVQRLIDLTDRDFYDGVPFHRVIEGFIAQTGDPTGTGTGKSDLPDLEPEFNDIKHVKGVVSMARSSDPASANSQFFFMLGDAPHLDGNYTAFGRVVRGMEFVEMIKVGNRLENGEVNDPDKIYSMSVVKKVGE